MQQVEALLLVVMLLVAAALEYMDLVILVHHKLRLDQLDFLVQLTKGILPHTVEALLGAMAELPAALALLVL
jgi:hypothetical protein